MSQQAAGAAQQPPETQPRTRRNAMGMTTKLRMRMLALGTTCTLLGAGIGGAAVAYQGHMYHAIDYLQSARQELIAAEGNKGGHRANAIHLIDQAIDEVNLGIQFAQQ
jgi:hypothetical protein